MTDKSGKKLFDEAFTEFINEKLDKEIAHMPPVEPSEAFEARMEALFRGERKPRTLNRGAIRALLAAAIALLSALAAFVIVHGIKKNAERPLLQAQYYLLQSTSDPEGCRIREEYELSKLPSGFEAVQPVRSEFSVQREYVGENGAVMVLTQSVQASIRPTKEYKPAVLRDENGEAYTVYALVEEHRAEAYWIRNDYLFSLTLIDHSLGRSAFLELIGSIEKVG